MHTPTNYRHYKNVCVYVCSCLNYRKIAKCKQFLGKVKEAKKKKYEARIALQKEGGEKPIIRG